MLSTQGHSTSILTRKEILDNGFLASSSSHSHSSPVLSYYMDLSGASKPDPWELPSDLDGPASGSSPCAAKPGSLSGSRVSAELHSLTQGVSDLSPACLCKAHGGRSPFELCGVSCEQPSREGCPGSVVSQNTSTPCRGDGPSEPLESLLGESSEPPAELSALGHTPAPGWDISAIKSCTDSSASLDVSAEEFRVLGCSKPDASSLEAPVVIPLAWPGAFRRQPGVPRRSAAREGRLNDPGAVPACLQQDLRCCCPGWSWSPPAPAARSRDPRCGTGEGAAGGR